MAAGISKLMVKANRCVESGSTRIKWWIDKSDGRISKLQEMGMGHVLCVGFSIYPVISIVREREQASSILHFISTCFRNIPYLYLTLKYLKIPYLTLPYLV